MTAESHESWTTLSVLDWTCKRFTQAGFEAARLEAQVLLAHGLGCDRMKLFTEFDKPLKDDELARCRELIRRRLGGEPVAYLTGTREFWSLPFAVDGRVLIPRPDSETIIETVLAQFLDRKQPLRILDLGTGSGALAVALAKEFVAATVVATDISADVIEVARHNVERLGFGERVQVRQGDLFLALEAGQRFDVLVSNPPYVESADIARLSEDVQREPRLALDGGPDGLAALRRIIAGAAEWLAGSAFVALEHGHEQGAAVRALLETHGFTEVATRSDLGGRPRVSVGNFGS